MSSTPEAVPGCQVMGRIDEVRPVADILRESWDDCEARLRSLGQAPVEWTR